MVIKNECYKEVLYNHAATTVGAVQEGNNSDYFKNLLTIYTNETFYSSVITLENFMNKQITGSSVKSWKNESVYLVCILS